MFFEKLSGDLLYQWPDNLPPPLSREQETAVFLRLGEGDPKARDILITHNLRLVVYIAAQI